MWALDDLPPILREYGTYFDLIVHLYCICIQRVAEASWILYYYPIESAVYTELEVNSRYICTVYFAEKLRDVQILFRRMLHIQQYLKFTLCKNSQISWIL
jgi:hypothetical protein